MNIVMFAKINISLHTNVTSMLKTFIYYNTPPYYCNQTDPNIYSNNKGFLKLSHMNPSLTFQRGQKCHYMYKSQPDEDKTVKK